MLVLFNPPCPPALLSLVKFAMLQPV